MYDYGARWYDPQIGRFISPDTIIPDPGNSQSFNRYSYVQNNPIKYTDPSGHCIPGVNCPSEHDEVGGYHVSEKPDTLTIYVDQPIRGSYRAYRIDGANELNLLLGYMEMKEIGDYEIDPGHTFVQITDWETGDTFVKGFYPDTPVHPIDNPETDGDVRNDVKNGKIHPWDVKAEFEITDEGFEAAKEKIIADEKNPPPYNLNTNNCTQWALDVAQTAGVENLPPGIMGWYVGKGPNPGTLGEELMRMNGERNTNLSSH